jgi:hypothetical protein
LKYCNDYGEYFSECVADLPQYGKRITSKLPFKVTFNLYNVFWKSAKKYSYNVSERVNLLSSPFIFDANVDSGKIAFTSRTNSVNMVNNGDVNAPVIITATCTGSGNAIKISKSESVFIELNYNFVSGETITINTENMTIESNLNGNIIKYLSNDSTFFTLDFGVNNISAAIDQPVVVKAEFYNRFVGV